MAAGRQSLIACVGLLMAPIARFCVRRSLRVQEVIEQVKVAFLEAAAAEIRRTGEAPNVSRLSATTGLHRRDVVRIFREGQTKEYSFNLVNRVIGQWQRDPRFISKSRRPRVLTYEGSESEFYELMQSVATDLKAGTVLFELERIGAVERTERGLKLVHKAYEPKTSPEESFGILGDDTEDLICAVEENVFLDQSRPNLHAKTVYDNIGVNSPEELEKIRDWIIRLGADFHKKARSYLSRYDLDINPRECSMRKIRIAVGTFGRVALEEEAAVITAEAANEDD